MIRLSFALAVLISAVGAAQAYVPKPPSPDVAASSDRDHTYVVFFEVGKASLTPQARQTLQVAAREAHAMREVKVRVMVSTAKGVTALSHSRARAVRAELVREGVQPRSIGNASRSEDVGYANADPVFRDWIDRSVVVKFSPLPNADTDRQAIR
jgi:outer membrane protein OmpA-like peptidoglycan-associated protein